jgi:hypothetical protein
MPKLLHRIQSKKKYVIIAQMGRREMSIFISFKFCFFGGHSGKHWVGAAGKGDQSSSTGADEVDIGASNLHRHT